MDIQSVATPAIVIAAVSLILQGIKASIDVVSMIATRTDRRVASEVASLKLRMQLIDNLPYTESERAAMKQSMLQLYMAKDGGEWVDELKEIVNSFKI